jgi:pyrroloquinoline quinone biosynthesis protein B
MDTRLTLSRSLELTAFPVPHREEFSDTLGFRISGPTRSILFIPDIQKWDKWTRSIAREMDAVDYALLDGTFFGRGELPGRDMSGIGHPLITESMDLLKDEAKKVYFTHLNHTNLALDPEGPAAKTVRDRGFHLAYDGQEFTL